MEQTNLFNSIRLSWSTSLDCCFFEIPQAACLSVLLVVARRAEGVAVVGGDGGGSVCGRLRCLSLFKNPIHTDLLKALMLISLSFWDFFF